VWPGIAPRVHELNTEELLAELAIGEDEEHIDPLIEDPVTTEPELSDMPAEEPEETAPAPIERQISMKFSVGSTTVTALEWP